MMKRSDQIFASFRIHAGLAADRAIDHRQKRRWDLHVRNAALKNRGDKPGKIADHAATEADDERLSIQSGAQRAGDNLSLMSSPTVASSPDPMRTGYILPPVRTSVEITRNGIGFCEMEKENRRRARPFGVDK